MIINLHGQVKNNEINFDSTQVYFEPNCYVAVTKVYIQFARKFKDVTGYISSSLIDKSPVNPLQELVFFNQRENSRTVFYSPTHLAQYKIQCPSLQASVFEIYCSDLDENSIKIEKIYLQLQISNARIQPVSP